MDLKLLFLSSSPNNRTNYNYEEEGRQLEEELSKPIYRNKIKVIREARVPIIRLMDLIRTHNPDILHFSGHGSENDRLEFEDSNGNSKEAEPELLSELFKEIGQRISLVSLIACYSKSQASKISQYVGCVIGTSNALPQNTAGTIY